MNSIPYHDIVIEHFLRAFIVPLSNDVTLSTLHYMHEGNLFILSNILALLSVIAATSLSWFLGHKIKNLRSKLPGLSEEHYAKASEIFGRYGVFLLVLWWIPVGTLLPFLAGAFDLKWRHILLPVSLGYFIIRSGYV